MSLNLDRDIHLKPPQIYEFVTHARWLNALEMSVLPGRSKLSGVGNYSEFAPVTLTEPGATASRHWDMSGFSWPWSLQVVSCVSLTDNFWPHTAELGTWATLRGSALTRCHIFSPEPAVSNLSLSTSGLGHFHFDFTLPLTPLSLENLKFSATPANVLYDQRVQMALSQPSHRDVWVGGSHMRHWLLQKLLRSGAHLQKAYMMIRLENEVHLKMSYLINLTKSGQKLLWKVTNQNLNEPSAHNRSKALKEECVGKYLEQNVNPVTSTCN